MCGVYGVCIEDEKDEGFKYLIADEYVLDSEIPDGYEVCEIPHQYGQYLLVMVLYPNHCKK